MDAGKKLSKSHQIDIHSMTEDDILALINELEVQQSELEAQNEDLMQAKSETDNLLNKYQELYDFAPVGYVTLDEQGNIIDANLTLTGLLGIERIKLINTHFDHFIPSDTRPAFYNFFKNVIKTDMCQKCQMRLIKNDDIVFYALLEGISIMDKKYPEVKHIMLSITDITDCKSIEENLLKEKDFSNILIESLPGIFCLFDFNGKMLRWNKYGENVIGYTADEISVSNPLDFIVEQDRGLVNKTIKDTFDKGYSSVESTLVTKRGEKIPFYFTGIRVMIDNVPCILSIAIDISERKKIEYELEKLRRLESIGILASGVAHDFNNLLTGILGNISLVKQYLDPEDMIFKRLSTAEKSCFEAREITSRLITFSKGGEPVKKVTRVQQLLKEAHCPLIKDTNITFEYNLPDNLYPVEIDEGQIRNVIINILTNAAEAMPEGGKIDISATNLEITEKDNLPIKEGSYVKVSIRDRGRGIQVEEISRIFDPYFSTKERGVKKGMGLGLTICHSIIRKHEGFITVESMPGAGTTFHLYLPASLKKKTETEVTGEMETIRKKRILIMDDDEIVRDITGDMLMHCGYYIESSKDGNEAIALYIKAKERGEPFDAVILDLVVPNGMGGDIAIKRLHDIDHGVKGIALSGYSKDLIMTHYMDYGFTAALSKPYNIQLLNGTLERVLGKKQD
ncbi:MAG: hypothetical protein A2Y48_09320 [Nitrospirae bacterium RIFCSPLOW2_12_42_9]|nr:MAG: hypothetical protein A2Y48_09320 [Nitrospirae bacterium RIFCSPLOW2_12_42_9]